MGGTVVVAATVLVWHIIVILAVGVVMLVIRVVVLAICIRI